MNYKIQVLPRFKLIVHEGILLRHTATTFKGLTTLGMEGNAHSATYDDVKSCLLTKLADVRGGREFSRQREGYVAVSVVFNLTTARDPDGDDVDQMLECMQRLALSIRLGEIINSQQPAHEATSFSLNAIKFRDGNSAAATNALLSSANAFSDLGIPVTSFGLSMHMTHDEAPLRNFLQKQLSSPQGRWICTLVLSLCRCNDAGVEAVCTAIGSSRSLRKVKCETFDWVKNGRGTDEMLRWQWLAYALFSGEEKHEQDVATRSPPTAVVLNPTAIIHGGWFAATASGANDDTIAVEAGFAYRVMWDRPRDDAVEILVASRGVCWVKRSDILERRPVTKRETHSVRHFTIKYLMDDSFASAAALLELIGGPIERLTINDFDANNANSAILFDAIFTHCPNLKHLDLKDCIFTSLQPLYTRANSLERLYLAYVNVDDLQS